MRDHAQEFRLLAMCRVFGVHRSGYYAWLQTPLSARAREDDRLRGLVKQSWLQSGTVYGYRKVTEHDEACGKHRVARLMRSEGLKAQIGYGRRPNHHCGKPSTVAPNHLDRQFEVAKPNTHWVTDITYLRTHEGWLYLAVVIDLFSRHVVGWSMRATLPQRLGAASAAGGGMASQTTS